LAYGKSNGHVTDDVTLVKVTVKVKGQDVAPIRLEYNIAKTARDSI